MPKNSIVAIGSIYVETNYLGLQTAGKDFLTIGHEYRASQYEMRLAGSVVNFALQLKKFGIDVAIIGKTGPDETGRKLLSLLQKNKIALDLIIQSTDPSIQTSIDSGLVLAHSSQNIQVVAGNANQRLEIKDIDFTNPHFKMVEFVYLGGFMKQESLYKDYPQLLKRFTNDKIKIILDHGRIPVDITADKKQVLLACLPYVTGYLPNEDELLAVSEKNNLDEALNWTLDQGVGFVVVKLGGKGCRIKDRNNDKFLPGYNVIPINTVGAGDAFNAGFIYAYSQESQLESSAQFGNATAALKISMNEYSSVSEILAFMGKA